MIEDDLYYYTSNSSDSDDDNNEFYFDQEELQDWYSEELLNLWMSIVEYHEEWYIPLNRTFNQFCEFVFSDDEDKEITYSPEIQAIKNHSMIKNRDWNYFFSLSYK